MANLIQPVTAQIWEDTTPLFMARVQVERSGALENMIQSDVSSISYAVYRSTTAQGTGTLTVSSVVFDTLQTGTIWTEDSTGYNFKTTLSESLFASPGRHVVEFIFTLTSGVVGALVYNLSVRQIRGS